MEGKGEMDNMTLEEEWLASLVGKRTKSNYTRGWKAFKDFLRKSPEEILELRKKEGKRFITRIVMFFDHLKKQGLSENTARTMVIPVQSFLSYFEVPLKVSDKLPNLHMKLESYRPTVEDLQKLYKYNDLSVKAWISLSRDCPARIGDLLRITPEQIQQGEFLIKSEKENVIGKVYISEETKDLFSKNPELPKSQRGIDKLLKRACEITGINPLNQHLLRKFWRTTATNLGIQETIIKILSFQAVPQATLTYFLDRTELEDSWLKIISALPLEPKSNGKLSNLEEDSKLFAEALWELVKPIVERKRLERLAQKTQQGIGLLEMEKIPSDSREGLKLFLKWKKEEETRC
jgi:integrase